MDTGYRQYYRESKKALSTQKRLPDGVPEVFSVFFGAEVRDAEVKKRIREFIR